MRKTDSDIEKKKIQVDMCIGRKIWVNRELV